MHLNNPWLCETVKVRKAFDSPPPQIAVRCSVFSDLRLWLRYNSLDLDLESIMLTLKKAIYYFLEPGHKSKSECILGLWYQLIFLK